MSGEDNSWHVFFFFFLPGITQKIASELWRPYSLRPISGVGPEMTYRSMIIAACQAAPSAWFLFSAVIFFCFCFVFVYICRLDCAAINI